MSPTVRAPFAFALSAHVPVEYSGPVCFCSFCLGAQEGIAEASLFQTDQVFLSQDFFFFILFFQEAERNAVKKLETGHVFTSSHLRVLADA